MTSIYKVGRVGGIPFLEAIRTNSNKTIDSIEFGGKSFLLQKDEEGRHLKIFANFKDAWVGIENQPHEVFLNSDECRELYLNFSLKIIDYTIEEENHPVEMTLDEIEKKLGHRILLKAK